MLFLCIFVRLNLIYPVIGMQADKKNLKNLRRGSSRCGIFFVNVEKLSDLRFYLFNFRYTFFQHKWI